MAIIKGAYWREPKISSKACLASFYGRIFCCQAVVIVQRNSWDDACIGVCCIFKAHLSRSLVSSTDRTSEVSFLVDISRHRAYLPRKKWTSFRPSPFFTDSKWIRHDRIPTTLVPRHDRLCISTTFRSEQLHYEERRHICLIYYSLSRISIIFFPCLKVREADHLG